MASLDEIREENKKTPPSKDVKDTCALVIRDQRRVRIEDFTHGSVQDRIDRMGGDVDDPENIKTLFDLTHFPTLMDHVGADDGPLLTRVLEVPPVRPLPFHLSFYGDRLSQDKRVVVVDETGRATIQKLMIPLEMRNRFARDGHLGAVGE